MRGTDFYFNAGYQPTIHRLIGENLTRTLQSGRAEIGRETDRSRLSLSFDYDERVFSSQSGNSPEESYTLLELTPLME